MRRGLVGAALAAVFLAVFALPSFAQTFTGRVDVTVVDGTGAVLPGVTVELSGVQKAVGTTDATGQAHFLNLAPGKYMVSAKLKGFADYKNDNVPVGTGSTIPLRVSMSLGGVSTSVSVKAETPLLEPKKEVVSTNVSLDEMQKIPSSRDPWVVLQTVPSVVVDRLNVGGAESGQQSYFQAKGASSNDNTWNIDGIAVTDMAATGSTPTYYDFDMFQEMNVATGGSDPSLATPGVALNMVLRTGTNAWRGSGRYYFENHSMQNNNVPANLVGVISSYTRIDQLKDYGFEGGGPLVKNRVFFQASAGETNPKINVFSQCSAIAGTLPSQCPTASATMYGPSSSTATVLQDYSAKATIEASKDTRLSFTYFRGNKVVAGRGADFYHPTASTWNQTGPTTMYKGEVNLTLSNTSFLSVRGAHITGGFSLSPIGGLTTPVYRDSGGVWHGSYVYATTDRPQDTISADGNVFKGKNELRFGFSWRKASVTSQSGWASPGGLASGNFTIDKTTTVLVNGIAYPKMSSQVQREHNVNTSAAYMSGYLGDTFTAGRLTLNMAVRWDHQAASLGAVSDPANTLDPGALLPTVSDVAKANVITWNSIVPRVGFAYAMDKDHKTLLRGSYAMFASQMSATQASVASAVQYSYTYYVNVPDLNGNHIADANELALGVLAASQLPVSNSVGTYKTPLTHEWTLGFDHQVARDFAISGTLTYRMYTNFDWRHLTGVDGSKYTAAGTYTCTAAEAAIVGTKCSVGYFSLPSSVPQSAWIYESRPSYRQQFMGLELNATKRMSHNWMMRASFSSGSATEHMGSLTAVLDPTPVAAPNIAGTDLGANVSGGAVSTLGAGSGSHTYFMVTPLYQFVGNMTYQAKHGINIGVNYVLRQGYAEPYYNSTIASGLTAQYKNDGLLLADPNHYPHLPAANSLDARIGKTFKLKNHTEINLDMDVFNLLNLNTVLEREYDLSATSPNAVISIMNPRIFRIGARISF